MATEDERAKKVAEDRKRRAQFAFITSTSEKWLWITDEKEAYVPAKVLKENPDGSAEVEVGVSQTVKTVKKNELGPLILRVSDLKNSFEDMVRMGDVNEATILHNLRMRFMEDLIYTNIGTILVSLNPFKWMEHLYKSSLIMEHLNTPVGEVSEPHVFQTAAAAYLGVRGERLNQSIIISGESGAGKTEATKQCLKFFAEAAGSGSAGMEKKLLSANPILEAFGNAKTVRNNNSSRFGKWMEVHFNGRAQICGSQIINYLLEKSRVAFQANGERSYHIFYQLCAASPPALRERLSLGKAEEYSYTNKSNCITVDGLNDVHEFKDLMEAFDSVEMGPAEYEPMFSLVASLLHLSNVVFEAIDSDSCRMSGSPTVGQELKHAARLMGVEADALRLAMEQKLIETRNERVRTPLSADRALDCRNSMAKAIYGRMFDWLVTRVNSSMTGGLSSSANVIGVLDIFGFEIFELNSFEQLCINFCNEKLQQHFNYHVFKAEEKCYQAEQIDYTEIKFVDNQDVLDLIERKPDGLLPKLDDEVKVPRGSDLGFLEKIGKTHHDNPRFAKGRRRGHDKGDSEFGVNHYAGTVYYDVRGFLEKNKDELMLNVRELLASSKEPFLLTIFSEENQSAAQKVAAKELAAGGTPAKSSGGGSDKQSQSSQFRAQLDSLMRTLNSTEPHYIRCIKPNSVKKGNIFEAPICLQQLRYAGVFEAVKVRQLGFPFRYTHDIFYKRYRILCSDPALKAILPKNGPPLNFKEKCRQVLLDIAAAAPDHLEPVDKMFKFGKTMVLYRADQHRVLEMIRDHVRETSSRQCQRVYRGHAGRKISKRLAAVRQIMRDAIKAREIKAVQAAIVEGRTLPFEYKELRVLVALEIRLKEEIACRERLQELYPVDPADHYAAYEAALKEADRLELVEPIVQSCRHKFSTVKDRIETKAAVQRGIALGDKAAILRAMAKAEELAKDWGDILGDEIRAQAVSTMKLIELEGQVQDDLRNAIMAGAAKGPIGALDASSVDITGLQAAIALATSGRVNIKTAMGQHLIASAKVLVELRLAMRSGKWEAIQAAVASAVGLRKKEELVAEAEAEVKAVEAELADKRIQNELLTCLSLGALPDRVGVITKRQMDVQSLADAIGRTKAAAEECGGISATAKHLLSSAELLLRLRQAFASNSGPDWAAIKKVVADGLEVRLADPCVPELAAGKAELDNHIIVHQLKEGLEKGSAAGTVARLDTSCIDVHSLTERIAHAEEVGVQTAQASALLTLARVVRRLREAMLRNDSDALLDIVGEAKDVPKEFVPQHTSDELLIARYEGENAMIVRTLEAAIKQGGPKGTVGAVDKTTITVKFLQEAVRKTTALKCRSEEALWLLEVAENLLDLRNAYVAGHWTSLQEMIMGLRGMHGMKPSETSNDYKRLADLPVLKPTAPAPHLHAGLGSRTSHATESAASRATHAPASRQGAAEEPAAGSDASSGAVGKHASYRSLGDVPIGSPAAAVMKLQAAGQAGKSTTSPPQAQTTIGFPSGLRGRGSSGDRRLPSIFTIASLRSSAADLHAALGTRQARRSSVAVGDAAEAHHHGHGYDLPAEVLAEVNLVQDELHNHTTVTELTTQLSTGGPVGELGALSGASVTVDGLAIALKKAARHGFKTALAASLAYTGTVVRDLRASLRDSDWKTVEATLKSVAANNARVARSLGRPLPTAPPAYLVLNQSGSLSPAPFAYMSTAALGPVPLATSSVCPPGTVSQEMAGLALAGPGVDEVVRIEAELMYRRTMEQLHAALTNGAARGAVGQLDSDGMDTDALAAAIDAARALGARTAQARHLTALCRLMWQMRTAVIEGDWPAVESLLVAGASVLGKGPDGRNTLEPGCSVPDAVMAETGLYKAEAHNRRIVSTLKAALVSQSVQGEVGRLNLSQLDVSGLQDGIKMALNLGVHTPEARCLVSTAVHMRAMRLALLGGQWEQLGSYLDYYYGAEAKSKPYSMQMRQVQEVADAAVTSPGKAKDVSSWRMVSTNTKDGIGMMGWWPDVVEPGIGSDSRNGSLDIMIEGVAPESGPEASLLQLELNNRNVIVELTKALGTGSAMGSVGKLDVSTLRTGELDWAVDYANRLGCATAEAESLLTTASIVKRIRLALGSMNWTALEDALTSARGKVLADVGADEIASAQDELDNKVILSEITAALARGRPQGRVGRLFTGSIELGHLNEAISLATRLGPKTAEAKQMLFTAKVVARLRGCLLNDDLAEASLTLEAVRGKLLATVALPEVNSIQDEVDNWTVCRQMAEALGKGGPAGEVGALDTSSIDIHGLETVLSTADELGVKTSEAVSLYTAAAQVYKLRCALLKDDWDGQENGVEALLQQCAAMPVTISDAAAAEIELLRAESINRRMILSLSKALASGGAHGPVGGLDMARVDTVALDAAIATAVEAGPRTQEAERLLSAAKLIRRLRSVLLAGSWQWVGSVLLEARGMKSSFPPVSLKELQSAQDELDNRAVLAQLRQAMRLGVPSGGIGAIDVTSIDTQPLDEALAYAKALGVKSTEANTAVATANLLRTVRQALRINDFSSAKEALEAAKDSPAGIDSAATDELALVGMAVDNWVVVTALTDAISSGAAHGVLGDADMASIAVEGLDAAIALTMKLGCNTVEARRCLVTALIVRRLRQAYLDQDYQFMSQVVAEASNEAESLLAPARRELASARDTLEFRSVMDKLKTATAAMDEAGLGDALARAGALNMGQHPRMSVRETVDTAASTLGRLQRVKAALNGATRALDPQGLMEALAAASSMGYDHSIVIEAKRTLSRIQEHSDRASLALKGMDALGMSAALRDAEALGLDLPVLHESRRVLALPRADFLRRELDAVLTSIATDGMTAGDSKVAPEASMPGASTIPSLPPFANGRAPSSVEARVVNCTVQVKDLFFADAPNPDDLIAHALGGGQPGGASARAGQPSAAAQAAIEKMKAQRHTEDNVKGAQARVMGGSLSLPSGVPMPLVLWTCPTNVPFKANGLGPAMGLGLGRATGQAGQGTAGLIGTAVPPLHSPLKRQFALDKYPRLKPAHMFSSKFTPSTTMAESGLMRWTSEPIHTSLTLLASAEARKAAVRVFRHILAFMGDRPLSKPTVLAKDILATGAAVPEVRDEILLQLAKQLTGNPSAASQERGWVLLYLALCTFPPSEELENALEVWLREAGAVPCVWALHLALYRGGPGVAGVPSAVEIGAALERARAPALPSMTLDGDPAGGLLEYSSSGVLPLADGLDHGTAAAAFLSSQGPRGLDADDTDDHHTQLAFMQAVMGNRLPLPPAAAAIVAQAQAQAQRIGSSASSLVGPVSSSSSVQGEKRPTPTKPAQQALPARAAPAAPHQAASWGASEAKVGDEALTSTAQASMSRIAALLGEPQDSGYMRAGQAGLGLGGGYSAGVPQPQAAFPPATSQQAAAVQPNRPTTPTKPGVSTPSPPLFSPIAKPTANVTALGSVPKRPAALPEADYTPVDPRQQINNVLAAANALAVPSAGKFVGGSMPQAGEGGLPLGDALEAKIAAIARQLEDI